MFVVIEGIDGAGKTTQIALLAERLRASGLAPLLLREPGSTELGMRVRQLVKGEDGNPVSINERAELLLFGAARAQLVEEVIRPALAEGQTVLCDRYIYSTVAYQGAGRGLDGELIATVNAAATGGLLPDLVILLDLDTAEAVARQHGRGADRFDQESRGFYERVRGSYLHQANADAARWVVINGAQPVEDIAQEIWEKAGKRCTEA